MYATSSLIMGSPLTSLAPLKAAPDLLKLCPSPPVSPPPPCPWNVKPPLLLIWRNRHSPGRERGRGGGGSRGEGGKVVRGDSRGRGEAEAARGGGRARAQAPPPKAEEESASADGDGR